jgi:hypothetical protein
MGSAVKAESATLVYFAALVAVLVFLGWIFRLSHPIVTVAFWGVALNTAHLGYRIAKQARLRRYSEEIGRRIQKPSD